MTKPVVDWSVFDKYERSEIECKCGAFYLSHSKHVQHEGKFMGVTRQPCPACGAEYDHIRAARSGPIYEVIGKKDIGELKP